eukprot:CAMPEP_0116018386 /NCGR_PEP_ID=MMETSP0321-20121206/8615_1 /TAXON_ID=163516 /ORGANISM="Leptocylindrus danicus var. danicus, Strain B650" /LENGTH=109 /DNA_ID=CAMNT_0003488765 /DNA_START=34 /DNA_END=363 /DNA_ORIENTATION=+
MKTMPTHESIEDILVRIQKPIAVAEPSNKKKDFVSSAFEEVPISRGFRGTSYSYSAYTMKQWEQDNKHGQCPNQPTRKQIIPLSKEMLMGEVVEPHQQHVPESTLSQKA